MKNFYIQTIVLLFVVLAGFTSKSNAQFASSNEVYCYQYVKTVDEGVTSYNPNSGAIYHHSYGDTELHFIVFQGNYLLIIGEQKVSQYLSNIAKGIDRYNYNYIVNWYKQPQTTKSSYQASYSTSSKYTYYNDFFKKMYSISKDKSEMIIWFLEKTPRYYYKRIDPESLKPNLDFLD